MKVETLNICPDTIKNLLNTKTSRRRFLAGMGMTGAALFAGCKEHLPQVINLPTPATMATPQIEKYAEDTQRKEIVEKVRKFEAEMEDRPLSYQEAKNYIPLLAHFFVNATPTKQSVQELIERTYIYDYSCLKERKYERITMADRVEIRLLSNDIQFLNEHPELRSEWTSKDTLDFFDPYHPDYCLTQGTSQKGKSFVFLDRTNDPFLFTHYYPSEFSKELYESNLHLQYKGESEYNSCEMSTPVTRFRCTTLHEMVHSDANNTKPKPLSRDLSNSCERILEKSSTHKRFPTQGEVSGGFRVNLFVNDNTVHASVLDEFITEYLARKMSIDENLPYRINFESPTDYKNYKIIFEQSGVSYQKLYEFHQKGDLEELLLHLARGAKNINFANRNEQLDFAVGNFLFRHYNEMVLWNNLEQYYPGIDTTVWNQEDLCPKKK